MNESLLVSGGEVLGRDGRLARADVLIRDGAVEAVGEIPAPEGVPVLDARDRIVIPGLINAHNHSGENYNPGLYENLPLDLWFLHSHQVTRQEPPARDVIYVRTLLGALRMLLNGTTTVVDFLYEAPEITVETLEPVVQAYRDAGIRASVLLGMADLTFLESLPIDRDALKLAQAEARPPSLERVLEVCRGAVEAFHEPDGLIQIGMAPSAPQRCSDALLEQTMELARARDLVWHTHVQETKTQRYSALRWHGRSFVELLAERDFLGPRTTLVHTIWLSDRDIELLAQTDTTAIHCLLSNLRLGDGVARLTDLLRAGVRVGLGTDGRGCDETLDMLELAKMTALVHKVRGERPEDWLTAGQALELLTTSASRCTGRGDRLGRLEPGALGDLVLLDRRSLTFTPLNDPVRQLIFGVASQDVDAVVVGGRVVVRDRKPVGLDLDPLLEQAERYAAAGREPVDPGPDFEQLWDAVRGVFDAAEASDVGVNGYICG